MIKMNTAVEPPMPELHTTGTLIKIGTEVLKNSKQTPYFFAEVLVKHPDKTEQTVDAVVYEASLEKNLERFVVGATVGVVVQLDGEYAGRTKMELAGAREFNLAKYNMNATKTEMVPVKEAL